MLVKVGGTLRSHISSGMRVGLPRPVPRNDRDNVIDRVNRSGERKTPRGAEFETGRERVFIVQRTSGRHWRRVSTGGTTTLHYKSWIQRRTGQIRRITQEREENGTKNEHGRREKQEIKPHGIQKQETSTKSLEI